MTLKLKIESYTCNESVDGVLRRYMNDNHIL